MFSRFDDSQQFTDREVAGIVYIQTIPLEVALFQYSIADRPVLDLVGPESRIVRHYQLVSAN